MSVLYFHPTERKQNANVKALVHQRLKKHSLPVVQSAEWWRHLQDKVRSRMMMKKETMAEKRMKRWQRMSCRGWWWWWRR